MPPALDPSDDEYVSGEDSDFVDDANLGQQGSESSDEDSDTENVESHPPATNKGKGRPTKRKRNGETEEAEDAGFENSGDEAIIEKGLKRQRRKGKKDDDDEGGEGGLVKTRSMRAQEKVEKKPLATTTGATIDVDALWAQMTSGKPPPSPSKPDNEAQQEAPLSPSQSRTEARPQPTRSPSTTLSDGPNEMIMIKRTYNFAGKVHTEEKLVSKHSAEAKLYLASLPDPASAQAESNPPDTKEPTDPFTKPRRPLKKARRSIFEPIVENLPVRTDLHFGIRKDASGVTLIGVTGKERKLNTVEKSAMDWAGFVDREGIKDELDAAGKSKDAYKARQEFLARVEGKRIDDERKARGLPTLS